MPEEVPQDIGKLLRDLRERRGLTQEAVAHRARQGLTVDTVRNIERGRTLPRRHSLDQFMAALGLDEAERDAVGAAWLQRAAPRPPSAAAPSPSGRQVAGTVPPARPLVGREQAEVAVTALLARDGTRLLSLTGPGGVGKTSLGLQVAERVSPSYRDGVVFVDLVPLSVPDLVPAYIAGALGLSEQGTRPLMATVVDYLSGCHLLLFLDNFEQVLGAAGVVAQLCTACPSVQVLVTSRMALRLRDEQVYPVAPLPYPAPGEKLGLDDLWGPLGGAVRPAGTFPAPRLRLVRGQRGGGGRPVRPPGRAPTGDRDGRRPAAHNEPGGPLGPPAGVTGGVGRGPRDLPARQRTMRDVIAWSYDLLAEEDKALFRRLAVFAGRCTLTAASAVCALGPDGESAEAVGTGHPLSTDLVERLSALVEAQLLEVVETGGAAGAGFPAGELGPAGDEVTWPPAGPCQGPGLGGRGGNLFPSAGDGPGLRAGAAGSQC